jgi:hypothetical protein
MIPTRIWTHNSSRLSSHKRKLNYRLIFLKKMGLNINVPKQLITIKAY